MRAGENDQRIYDKQSKPELKLQKLNLLFYASIFFSIQGRLKCKLVCKLGKIRTFALERRF